MGGVREVLSLVLGPTTAAELTAADPARPDPDPTCGLLVLAEPASEDSDLESGGVGGQRERGLPLGRPANRDAPNGSNPHDATLPVGRVLAKSAMRRTAAGVPRISLPLQPLQPHPSPDSSRDF